MQFGQHEDLCLIRYLCFIPLGEATTAVCRQSSIHRFWWMIDSFSSIFYSANISGAISNVSLSCLCQRSPCPEWMNVWIIYHLFRHRRVLSQLPSQNPCRRFPKYGSMMIPLADVVTTGIDEYFGLVRKESWWKNRFVLLLSVLYSWRSAFHFFVCECCCWVTLDEADEYAAIPEYTTGVTIEAGVRDAFLIIIAGIIFLEAEQVAVERSVMFIGGGWVKMGGRC